MLAPDDEQLEAVDAARDRRSLRRDSGDVSAGYSVTKAGRSAGSAFSPRVVEQRPDPLAVRVGLAQHRAQLVAARAHAARVRSTSTAPRRRPASARSRPPGKRSRFDASTTASFIGMRGHGDARLDRLPLVRQRLAARDLARQLQEHRLGQRHQVLVGRVRLIELQHRELGVVLARQPLVAEVAADLVDALEAADDQPLEVQLGRDAHVEVEIERVVMGRERARRGAAQDRVHHRRLDLEEPARVEEAADAGARSPSACGTPRAPRG